MASEREQLKLFEVFSEIRPQVFQQAQNLQTLQQLEPQIQQAQTKFNDLLQVFETEQKQYQLAEKQLKHTLDFEQQHQQALNQVRQSIQERAFIADEYKKCKEKKKYLSRNSVHCNNSKTLCNSRLHSLSRTKFIYNSSLLRLSNTLY